MPDPSTTAAATNPPVSNETAGRGRSGGRGPRRASSGNKQMIESLREACPAHKQKDLLDLVKSLNYNEEKIREKISEWWDEPTVPSEGDWEDVNKKTNAQSKITPAASTKSGKGAGRGGRGGDAAGRGRSNAARGRGGRDGRGRGGGRVAAERNAAKSTKPDEEPVAATTCTAAASDEKSAPSFVGRPPQGAWAKKTAAAEPPVVTPTAPETSIVEPVPTPSVRVEPIAVPEIAPPAAVAPSVSTGNVWATRGSAHLIKAEKPVPPPPKPIVPPSITRTTGNGARTNAPASAAAAPTAPTTAAVDRSTMLSSLEGMPAVAPVPEPEPVPPTALPRPAQPPVMHNAWGGAPTPAAPEPPTVPPVTMPEVPPTVKPPTSVLNMGRWETNDADEANLDFGFGSFGASADDVGGEPEPTAASPARPPPGLSISGMPPMPANAVLVHELENKLEEVSVSKQQPDVAISGLGHAPPHHAPQYGGVGGGMMDPSVSSLSAAPIYSNSYSSAGGMYNPNPNSYSNPTGSAMTGHAFMANLPPPPKGGPLPFTSATSAPSNDATGANANNNPSASTMPPGMPAGMPYGNPMYYQQQQFVMGHQQPGLGYNYGYGGPFAGQGAGFGYPGGMHGNAAYGGPTYDDAGGVAGGGVGGYDPQQSAGPKNAGGYRGGGGGRHNNNQYQQQYNPQPGYGGQPYGMGYHNDHFNQRGAYQNMQDPYMQQQQQQQPQGLNNYGGGFQGDNQYKGKKNNRSGGGGGGGLNQFQQQGGPQLANQNQHLAGGAPSFGLQGQDNVQQGADGWPNQGGGWSGGGATSWQQGK